VVARFLGYDLVIQHNVELRPNGLGTAAGGARPPGHWKVPADVVREECTSYCARGKPIHRNDQLQNDTFSVAVRYEWACRGVVEYYLLASNLRDLGWLKWVMETSLTKTLVAKQQISARQVYPFSPAARHRPIPSERLCRLRRFAALGAFGCAQESSGTRSEALGIRSLSATRGF
jgi:hypothetical protein